MESTGGTLPSNSAANLPPAHTPPPSTQTQSTGNGMKVTLIQVYSNFNTTVIIFNIITVVLKLLYT